MVCLCVLSVGHIGEQKLIKRPFEMWTPLGLSKHVLDGVLDPPREGAFFLGGGQCGLMLPSL